MMYKSIIDIIGHDQILFIRHMRSQFDSDSSLGQSENRHDADGSNF